MAKQKSPPAPGSYEIMAARIQKIINAPAAQKAKEALFYKLDRESQPDWDRVLEEIAETDNVTMAHRDDGGVQLFWVVPKDD